MRQLAAVSTALHTTVITIIIATTKELIRVTTVIATITATTGNVGRMQIFDDASEHVPARAKCMPHANAYHQLKNSC